MDPSSRDRTAEFTSASLEPHPTDELLAAYGLGRCSQAEAEQIGEHVLRCDRCCSRLGELPEDSLLKQLGDGGTERASRRGDETNGGLVETDVMSWKPRTPGGEMPDFADLLRGHPKYEFVP